MLVDGFITRAADERPDDEALVCGQARVSYGELRDKASRVASALSALGIGRGERVVIALENSPEYVVAHFGVLLSGAVSVPVYHATPPSAFEKMAADCTPRAVISRPRLWAELMKSGSCAGIRHIVAGARAVGEPGCVSFDECLKAPAGPKDMPRSADDLAMIIYTSGTTGEPKGVMLSHSNLVANTLSIVEYLGLTREDRVMAILPFYYSYGNSVLLTHMAAGGTVIADNRFMYPNRVLEAMAGERATGFSGVPSTFAVLCHRSSFRNMSFPSLRYMTQAGGAMPHSMAFELEKVVPHAKIYIMYGQTEASARLSYLPPEDLYRKEGSAGKAIPGVTLEVVGADGEPVGPGETGEIVASGANIMMGYWGRPVETAEALKEGRLFTGDMATVDEDGYIYITGRRTEMIKSGGHRIAPREIEEVLLRDAGVFEAAVAGRPDAVLGEALCAFVVLKEGAGTTCMGLQRLCHESLPPYKVPREIIFVRSLPRTENMKVKRGELMKMLHNNAEVV